MATAQMHDNTSLDVSVRGEGPTVLLPVRSARLEGEAADRLRAWGTDPDLGDTLAAGLAEAGFRVVTADYEGHLAEHPKPSTLTASAVAADLLAVADAAGADRFAYYGYSWLALAGLQLATRTDRLAALAMGGFPALGAPFGPMLTVTEATHRMAVANRDAPPPAVEPEPGDWDSAEVTLSPDQTGQYLTLYRSLQDFDEQAALARLTVPRLVFAGADDNIRYGPKWDNAYVPIGETVAAHHDRLTGQGWTVEVLPGADHISAMQPATVLPLLIPWLREHWH
jgi:pimeloyl-ACP methyl ester carboxylesterase